MFRLLLASSLVILAIAEPHGITTVKAPEGMTSPEAIDQASLKMSSRLPSSLIQSDSPVLFNKDSMPKLLKTLWNDVDTPAGFLGEPKMLLGNSDPCVMQFDMSGISKDAKVTVEVSEGALWVTTAFVSSSHHKDYQSEEGKESIQEQSISEKCVASDDLKKVEFDDRTRILTVTLPVAKEASHALKPEAKQQAVVEAAPAVHAEDGNDNAGSNHDHDDDDDDDDDESFSMASFPKLIEKLWNDVDTPAGFLGEPKMLSGKSDPCVMQFDMSGISKDAKVTVEVSEGALWVTTAFVSSSHHKDYQSEEGRESIQEQSISEKCVASDDLKKVEFDDGTQILTVTLPVAKEASHAPKPEAKQQAVAKPAPAVHDHDHSNDDDDDDSLDESQNKGRHSSHINEGNFLSVME